MKSSFKFGYYEYIDKKITRIVLDSETDRIPFNAVRLDESQVDDWLNWKITDNLWEKVWE